MVSQYVLFSDWDEQKWIKPLDKALMTKLNKITKGMKVGKHSVEWNTDCCLHGYWGAPERSPNTMVTQGCLLGIPSIQLKIPRSLRRLIANSDSLI